MWPTDSTKYYWSLLKTLLNEKKVPCIPPTFHNNKYVIDFKEKSEVFNSFFANQCSLIPNNSILPSELKLLTQHTLTSCDFSETDILQIINIQDSNKAHGHDKISIRMLKLYGEAICRPLNTMFKTCLNTGKFLSEWKKGNVVPIYKKMTNRMLKITVLYHSYLYAVSCLNAQFITLCMIFFLKITSFLQTSQDLDRVTLASINSFLLIMKL